MQAADRIVTAAEMTEIDRRAQDEFGIPGIVLMENAGQHAWSLLRDQISRSSPAVGPLRIAFIAGNGNNGGDALVMARQARIDGAAQVLIVTVAEELKGAARDHWRILERLGVRRLVWSDEHTAVRGALQDADWIVDGIAGTGLSGALREPGASLVEEINRSTARVVAVDVPSGLRDGYQAADPVVRADVTVVTGYLKVMLYEGQNRTVCGDIYQVDPGFPPSLIADTQVVASRIALMPRRTDHPVPVDVDGHKGLRGRVLVAGGSAGTWGASVLSAEGAAAAGVGMVRVLTSAQAIPAVLTRNPSFMVGELSPNGIGAQERAALEWADAVVLGPGWTTLTDGELAEWLRLSEKYTTAVILDASALRVLAQRGTAWERLLAGTVSTTLTPHIGEWRELDRSEDLSHEVRGALETFPRRPGLTVVVKSSVTWTRHSTGEIDVLDGRTAILATAGSGDVLSGVVAGAVARVEGAGQGTPEMIRDALRWALARHLEAGHHLAVTHASATAAEIAQQIALATERGHG